MRALLSLVFAVSMLGCAPRAEEQTGPPSARPPRSPFPGEMASDVRDYLTEVYGQIQPWWHMALKKARTGYDEDNCVNQRDKVAVVSLSFDDQRQPARRPQVFKASGCKLFDETALSVFSYVRELPPLPRSVAEQEGRLTLRWSFFRDERGCEPAFAGFNVQPYPPGQQLARALQRKDWQRARQVIAEHRDPATLRVLAEAGLASSEPRVRRLALRVASTDRVESALRAQPGPETWKVGVQVLESRRAVKSLVRLLEDAARVHQAAHAPRILLMLAAIQRLGGTVPPDVLEATLAHPAPDVVLTALKLVEQPQPLMRVRPRWKGNPGMTAALAVRWASLFHDPKAVAAARKALAGAGRSLALRALQRFPLAKLAPDLAQIVRSGRVPAEDRVRAIKALCRLGEGSRTPLYAALLASEPAVQIAAARALGRSKKERRGATFRLAELARRTDGPVCAAALAAQARLGLDGFMRDVVRRARRLEPRYRAEVLASLWGYGAAAVPALTRAAKRGTPAEIAAIRACLGRIDDPAASQALQQLPAAPQRVPASGPASGPLEQLLSQASHGG